MNLDSFLYDDKNISFTSKDKNFVTFIGDMNDKLFSNISMINKNDFVMIISDASSFIIKFIYCYLFHIHITFLLLSN